MYSDSLSLPGWDGLVRLFFFFYDVFIMVQHDLIIHVLHTSSSRNVDNQSGNFLLPQVCCAKLTRARAQSPRSSALRKQQHETDTTSLRSNSNSAPQTCRIRDDPQVLLLPDNKSNLHYICCVFFSADTVWNPMTRSWQMRSTKRCK